MRLFVALDLSEGLCDGVMALQDGLGVGREVSDQDLHLTLAFLGERSLPEVEVLHEMLSAIRASRVRMHLRGVDVFGGRHPSVAVGLFEKVPELLALQEKVMQAARMAGIDLTRRRFKPHVTLARFPRNLPDFAEARIGAWLASYGDATVVGEDARYFSLIQSTLREDGPIYEVLARYPLLE